MRVRIEMDEHCVRRFGRPHPDWALLIVENLRLIREHFESCSDILRESEAIEHQSEVQYLWEDQNWRIQFIAERRGNRLLGEELLIRWTEVTLKWRT